MGRNWIDQYNAARQERMDKIECLQKQLESINTIQKQYLDHIDHIPAISKILYRGPKFARPCIPFSKPSAPSTPNLGLRSLPLPEISKPIATPNLRIANVKEPSSLRDQHSLIGDSSPPIVFQHENENAHTMSCAISNVVDATETKEWLAHKTQDLFRVQLEEATPKNNNQSKPVLMDVKFIDNKKDLFQVTFG
jgi:hypothetical protein